MQKLRTVFFGTSEFGLPALEWLFQNTDLQAVITTPDKPSGRKQELIPSPVKQWAERNNIRLLQPDDLKDEVFQNVLRDLDPEVAIVASYGKIIPQKVLDIPKYKSLNLHPSLLPKYRGATPVQNAILNGDKITGTTLMLMDDKMDHGPILAQKKYDIWPKTTYPQLHEELGKLSAEVLAENWEEYVKGELTPQPQDEAKAIYVKLLTKEDGKIDWKKEASEIERQIRAFTPWPGTYTVSGEDTIKIFKAQISDKKLVPGETLIENKKLFVGTASSALEILELQMPGGKRLTAEQFLTGFRGELKFNA